MIHDVLIMEWPLKDYGNSANPFKQARKEIEKTDSVQLQREAKEKGNNIPKQLPVSSMHRVSPSALPAWPEGIRNYLVEKPHRIRTA